MAPFANLFLILTVIATGLVERSKGLEIKPVKAVEGEECRALVVHVLKNGTLRLNAQALKGSGLQSRLRDAFSTRAERVVFLTAEPEIPFQGIAEVIDTALREADYVGILTPSVERELKPGFCLAIPPPSHILILRYYQQHPHDLEGVCLWAWQGPGLRLTPTPTRRAPPAAREGG